MRVHVWVCVCVCSRAFITGTATSSLTTWEESSWSRMCLTFILIALELCTALVWFRCTFSLSASSFCRSLAISAF